MNGKSIGFTTYALVFAMSIGSGVVADDHCCFYENETLTCMDITDPAECSAVGGKAGVGSCASVNCEEYCDYVPRIVRHGSARSHDGVEYLIPSGQSECRFLDGTFEAVFEFDRPVVGVCDDSSFCLGDIEIAGGTPDSLQYQEGDSSLRVVVTGVGIEGFVAIRFIARDYLAIQAGHADVYRQYSFYWPILLSDVNDNGVADKFDFKAIAERDGEPLDICNNFRCDNNLDGLIQAAEEMHANSAPDPVCRVHAVSRKDHNGICYDIPAGEVETRLEDDGSGDGTQDIHAVFKFRKYDFTSGEPVTFEPKPLDCSTFASQHFCVTSGSVTSVNYKKCGCNSNCSDYELTVDITGVTPDEIFAIAFDVRDDDGTVVTVNKSWIIYTGAVGYPDPVADLCDHEAHENFVQNTGLGYGETVGDSNFRLDLDLDGFLLWFKSGEDIAVFSNRHCANAPGVSLNSCCTAPIIGRCCLQNGNCQVMSEEQCQVSVGFFTPRQTCDSVNCVDVEYPCCLVDFAICLMQTPSECQSWGGVLMPELLDCQTGSCPVFGACCEYDSSGISTCSITEEAECAALGGAWWLHQTCAIANCETRAMPCCLSDNTCSMMSAANCVSAGGAVIVTTEDCAAITCPAYGACCYLDSGTSGKCEYVVKEDCDTLDGMWHPFEDCGIVECAYGTCCTVSGGAAICAEEYQGRCEGSGGVFTADVACASSECPEIGNCRFVRGNEFLCEEMFEVQCQRVGGYWEGGPTCAQSPINVLYVDVNVPSTGQGTGDDWANAFVELDDALQYAVTLQGLTEIRVADGVYSPIPSGGSDPRSASFLAQGPVVIRGGFPGNSLAGYEDVCKPDVFATVLDGDLMQNDLWNQTPDASSLEDNAYHVLTIDDGDGMVTIAGCRIQGGVADGLLPQDQYGGGVYKASSGTTRLSDVVVQFNSAVSGGAGIYALDGNVVCRSSVIRSNLAPTGAGVYLDEGVDSGQFVWTDFYANFAKVSGAGLYATGTASLDFVNSMFRFNSVGNTVTPGDGAGLSLFVEPPPNGPSGEISATLVNCLFHDNRATGTGGGIYASGAAVQLVNSTLSQNTAPIGSGGLYVDRFPNSSSVKITNSILMFNFLAGSNDSQVAQVGCAEGLICAGVDSAIDVTYSAIRYVDQMADGHNVDPFNFAFQDAAARDFRVGTFGSGPPYIDIHGKALRSTLSALGDAGDADGDGILAEIISLDLSGYPREAVVSFGTGYRPILDMGAYQLGSPCCGVEDSRPPAGCAYLGLSEACQDGVDSEESCLLPRSFFFDFINVEYPDNDLWTHPQCLDGHTYSHCFYLCEAPAGDICLDGPDYFDDALNGPNTCLGNNGVYHVPPKFCQGDPAYFWAQACDLDAISYYCESDDTLENDVIVERITLIPPDQNSRVIGERIIQPGDGIDYDQNIKLETSQKGRYFILISFHDLATGSLALDDPDRVYVYAYDIVCDTNSVGQLCSAAGQDLCCNQEGAPPCDFDCNNNLIPDADEIACDPNLDRDGNCVLDECQSISCPPVDIVFVVDTSQSMGPPIGIVCLELANLLYDLQTTEEFDVHATVLSVTNGDMTQFLCGGSVLITPWNLGPDTPVYWGGVSGIFPPDVLVSSVYEQYGISDPGQGTPNVIEGTCCRGELQSGDYVANCTSDNRPLEDWGVASALVARHHAWREGAIRLVVPISDEMPCGGTEWELTRSCEFLLQQDLPMEFNCTDIDLYDVENDETTPVDGELYLTLAEVEDISVATKLVEIANDNDVIVSPVVVAKGSFLNAPGLAIDPCVFATCRFIAAKTGGLAVNFTPATQSFGPVRNIIEAACATSSTDALAVISLFNVTEGEYVESAYENGMRTFEVSACDLLRFDASASMPQFNATYEWKIDDVTVSDDVEYDYSSSGAASVVIRLIVRDAFFVANTTTARINFSGRLPTAYLTGPTRVALGIEAVFSASVQTSCAPTTWIEWDSDGSGTFGPQLAWPQNASQGITFSSTGTQTVRVRLTDADGITATAELDVEVVDANANEDYREVSDELIVQTQRHTYERVGNNVIHRVEMRVGNLGTQGLSGPIVAALADLSPVVANVTSFDVPVLTSGPGGAVNHIEFVADNALLASNAYTDWAVVEFEYPFDTGEAFEFNAVAYLIQQGPRIFSVPSPSEFNDTDDVHEIRLREGRRFEYQVRARDPENDPIFFQLVPAPLPEGMAIGGQSGLLTWTPGQTAGSAEGTVYDVTIRASDGREVASQNLRFIVTSEELAPQFLTIPNPTEMSRDAFNTPPGFEYTARVEDPDGDLLSVTVAPSSHFSITDLGNQNWKVFSTTTLPEDGVFAVQLTATDVASNVTTQEFILSVYDEGVCPSQSRPNIDRTQPLPDFVQGLSTYHQFELVPELEGINWSLEIAPDGMEIDPESGLLSWFPPYDSPANVLVRVVASNSTGGYDVCRDAYSLSIDITDRNALPSVTNPPDMQIDEGEFLNLRLEAQDLDRDRLSYRLIDDPQATEPSVVPPGMSIHTDLGILRYRPSPTAVKDISGDPNAEQVTVPIRVRVTDSANGFSDVTFDLTINEVDSPPQIVSLPDSIAYENDPSAPIPALDYRYEIVVVDVDSQALDIQYALAENKPDGMTLDTNVLPPLLTWRPMIGDSEDNPHVVDIIVTDETNQQTTQTLNIEVRPLTAIQNAPPQITFDPPPPTFMFVGQSYSYQVQATDSDAPLTYSIITTEIPVGGAPIDITTDGEITWIPNATNLDGGNDKTYDVRVIVRDSGDPNVEGDSSYASFEYSIRLYPADANPCDSVPVFNGEPLTSAVVGVEYVFDFVAFDPGTIPPAEGGICNPPDELSFDLVPASVALADGSGVSDLSKSGPVVSAIPYPDAPGNYLASFRWTPGDSDVGQYRVAIRISDLNSNEPVYVVFPLSVTRAGQNRPPRITSSPDRSAKVGEEYVYNVLVDDPDFGDIHEFHICPHPAGAVIDKATGAILWIPQPGQEGVTNFKVTVSDRSGATDEQAFDVAIVGSSAPILNAPPMIFNPGNRYAQVDANPGDGIPTLDVTINATDVEGSTNLTIEFGPAGMTLNGADLEWSPTAEDKGTHIVRLRATDSGGAFDETEFLVTVSDSTTNPGLPVIISRPLSSATLLQEFRYDLMAYVIGAGSPALHFELVNGPAGAGVVSDADGDRVVWTPGRTQLGQFAFVVRVVNDADTNAWSEQRFDVYVIAEGSNEPPCICSLPIERAISGTGVYTYQVSVTDDAAPLRVEFDSPLPVSPGGMTISDNGLISWDLSGETNGAYPVTVRVEDADGAWTEQSYVLTLSNSGTNSAPRIVSTPRSTASNAVGSPGFEYLVAAVDDSDSLPALAFSIIDNGGQAVAFDGVDLNRLVWNTEGVPQGTYTLEIGVADSELAETRQSFDVTVSNDGLNEAPKFASEPPQSVREAATLLYVPILSDPNPEDESLLTLSFVDSIPPVTGVNLAQLTNGVFEWDTTGIAVGSYRFTLAVTDPENASSQQTFDIHVVPNKGPKIVSIPVPVALSTNPYTYELRAEDPDHEPEELHWSIAEISPEIVGTGPTTTDVIGGSMAQMTWNTAPDPLPLGRYRVRLSVTDGLETDYQVFYLKVVDSLDEVDTLAPRIAIHASPASVALDGSSEVVTVTVEVTDDLPLTIDTDVTLVVKRYANGVETTVTAPGTQLAPDNDGDGTPNYMFTIQPTDPGVYLIEAEITDDSLRTGRSQLSVLATAEGGACTPGGGNEAECIALAITDLRDADEGTSLGAGGAPIELNGPVTIHGFAFDQLDEFARYQLAYRPTGRYDLEPYVFETNNVPVSNVGDALGTLDTMQMPNGMYDLFLRVETLGGDRERVATQQVIVTGDQKVGNFTLTFTDLAIPVEGVPAIVNRTYDSRVKFRGDFGVGWSSDLTSISIQESTPVGVGWGVQGGLVGCYAAEAIPHVVSIAWSDGRVESFSVVPRPFGDGPQAVSGCTTFDLDTVQSVQFNRISTGTSTLEAMGTLPVVITNEGGILSVDGTQPIQWQPSGYRVTIHNGAQFEFSLTANTYGHYSLHKIIDTNGNTLVFERDGIKRNETDYVIRFERDALGVIHRVIDPMQNAIEYEYDNRGDLVEVRDRTGNPTQFVYNDDHGLVDVINALGYRAVRNDYDDDGALLTQIDADGNATEYCRPSRPQPWPEGCYGPPNLDPQALADALPAWVDVDNYESVRNPVHLNTVFFYDERGNVEAILKVSASGEIKSVRASRFDDFDRVIEEIDPVGRKQTYDYDGDTDLVTRREEYMRVGEVYYLTGSEEFTYDDRGNTLTHTDGRGKLTEMVYDDHGNLTTVIDAEGNETVRTYVDGRLSAQTDRNGNTKHATYNDLGLFATETDEAGRTATYGYNANGIPTSISFVRQLAGGQTEINTIAMEVDAEGRMVREISPFGGVVVTEYNAAGLPERVISPNGAAVSYQYGSNGDLCCLIHPDNTTASIEYDEAGNEVSNSDRDGQQQRIIYNDSGLPERQYAPTDDPGNWASIPYTEVTYDEAEREIETAILRDVVDGPPETILRVTTSYEYDVAEQMRFERKTLYDGVQTSEIKLYIDENGLYVKKVDSLGNVIEWPASDRGFRERTILQTVSGTGGASEILNEYDNEARTTADISPSGRRTQYELDAVGRTKKVIDNEGNQWDFAYDNLGNLLRFTDAEERSTWTEVSSIGRLTLLPMGQTAFLGTQDARGIAVQKDFNDKISLLQFDMGGNIRARTLPNATLTGELLDTNSVVGGYFRTHLSTDRLQLRLSDFSVAGVGRLYSTTAPGVSIVPDIDLAQDLLHDLSSADLADLEAGNWRLEVTTPENATLEAQIPAPPQNTIVYDYSPGGARVQFGGVVRTFDDRYRVESETMESGDVIRYEYDLADHVSLVEVTPAGGGGATYRKKYEYDGRGRLSRVFDAEVEPSTLVTEYVYDGSNNFDEIRCVANDTVADYQFDERNRLVSITNKRMSTGEILSSYTYEVNEDGLRTKVTEHSGRIVEYEYDDVDRLVAEAVSGTADSDFMTTYEYDKVGNRTKRTITTSTASAITLYGYDLNDRLVSESTSVTQLASSFITASQTIYARASDGINAAETRTDWGSLWAALGATGASCALAIPIAVIQLQKRRTRRRKFLSIGTALMLIPLVLLAPRDLVAINQSILNLTMLGSRAVTNGAMAPWIPDEGTLTYTWDGNGNLLSRSNGTSTDEYFYNFDNRLVECRLNIGKPAEVTIRYGYDDEGLRTWRTIVGGDTTRYVFDRNRPFAQVLVEVDESTSGEVHYTYGYDLLRQVQDIAQPSATRFYHYDGQMSVRHLTDEFGASTGDGYDYDAFGLLCSGGGPTANPYRYGGEHLDPDMLRYYQRARWYDQGTGRFMQRDRFPGFPTKPSTLNRYVFASANPVNFADPSGFVEFSLTGLLSAIGIERTNQSIDNSVKMRIRQSIRKFTQEMKESLDFSDDPYPTQMAACGELLWKNRLSRGRKMGGIGFIVFALQACKVGTHGPDMLAFGTFKGSPHVMVGEVKGIRRDAVVSALDRVSDGSLQMSTNWIDRWGSYIGQEIFNSIIRFAGEFLTPGILEQMQRNLLNNGQQGWELNVDLELYLLRARFYPFQLPPFQNRAWQLKAFRLININTDGEASDTDVIADPQTLDARLEAFYRPPPYKGTVPTPPGFPGVR